ncbi:MAG: thiosulfate oxidation carrier complex protein SoxZ [Kiloniellaceae bacterium]
MRTMISAPKTARRGEVIEIKTMIAHAMETGYRRDSSGRPVPRNIVNRFVCTYDGEEVFSAELFPAVAANPLIAFTTVAVQTGRLTFAWTDDSGNTETASVEITVT